MDTKNWYESKTLWTNALGVAAIVAQGVTGKQVIDPAAQGVVLGVLNLILRLVTKSEVVW